MKQYYQCRMQRVVAQGVTETTQGWIEERGAKVGAKVELDKSKDLWEVLTVSDYSTPEDQLKAGQRLARTYAKRTDI